MPDLKKNLLSLAIFGFFLAPSAFSDTEDSDAVPPKNTAVLKASAAGEIATIPAATAAALGIVATTIVFSELRGSGSSGDSSGTTRTTGTTGTTGTSSASST